MQQNNIPNKPCPKELAEHTKLVDKTGSSLEALIILTTHLQQYQKVVIFLMTTSISKVKNN